jgi:hypothetical protein
VTIARVTGVVDARLARAQRLVYTEDDLQRALTEAAAGTFKGSILIAASFTATRRFTLPANVEGLTVDALPSTTIRITSAMDSLFLLRASYQKIRGVRATCAVACPYLVRASRTDGANIYAVEVSGNDLMPDENVAALGAFYADSEVYDALVLNNVRRHEGSANERSSKATASCAASVTSPSRWAPAETSSSATS